MKKRDWEKVSLRLKTASRFEPYTVDFKFSSKPEEFVIGRENREVKLHLDKEIKLWFSISY